MIDENSHHSQQSEDCESVMFSLRKRAPIDCLFAQPPVAQEPNRKNTRRPRFSFFHLHNVKDLTS
ncbi:hypothetical protein, partial [Devosia limi]|uniref:hypothetical protein n=1 Tax=Devosia limi TaxID=288995 RepID=UPI001AEBDF6B